MTWNYRIIKTEHEHLHGECVGMIEESYEICEVYYDENNNIKNWTGGVSIRGDDIAELKADLKWHEAAFDHPVLLEKNGKLVEIDK